MITRGTAPRREPEAPRRGLSTPTCGQGRRTDQGDVRCPETRRSSPATADTRPRVDDQEPDGPRVVDPHARAHARRGRPRRHGARLAGRHRPGPLRRRGGAAAAVGHVDAVAARRRGDRRPVHRPPGRPPRAADDLPRPERRRGVERPVPGRPRRGSSGTTRSSARRRVSRPSPRSTTGSSTSSRGRPGACCPGRSRWRRSSPASCAPGGSCIGRHLSPCAVELLRPTPARAAGSRPSSTARSSTASDRYLLAWPLEVDRPVAPDRLRRAGQQRRPHGQHLPGAHRARRGRHRPGPPRRGRPARRRRGLLVAGGRPPGDERPHDAASPAGRGHQLPRRRHRRAGHAGQAGDGRRDDLGAGPRRSARLQRRRLRSDGPSSG